MLLLMGLETATLIEATASITTGIRGILSVCVCACE